MPPLLNLNLGRPDRDCFLQKETKIAKMEELMMPNAPARATSSFPGSSKKGQFQPLPMAVNILKSNLAEPLKLRLHTDNFVRGILVCLGNSERTQKSCMKLGTPWCHMLQIAENAAGR